MAPSRRSALLLGCLVSVRSERGVDAGVEALDLVADKFVAAPTACDTLRCDRARVARSAHGAARMQRAPAESAEAVHEPRAERETDGGRRTRTIDASHSVAPAVAGMAGEYGAARETVPSAATRAPTAGGEGVDGNRECAVDHGRGRLVAAHECVHENAAASNTSSKSESQDGAAAAHAQPTLLVAQPLTGGAELRLDAGTREHVEMNGRAAGGVQTDECLRSMREREQPDAPRNAALGDAAHGDLRPHAAACSLHESDRAHVAGAPAAREASGVPTVHTHVPRDPECKLDQPRSRTGGDSDPSLGRGRCVGGTRLRGGMEVEVEPVATVDAEAKAHGARVLPQSEKQGADEQHGRAPLGVAAWAATARLHAARALALARSMRARLLATWPTPALGARGARRGTMPPRPARAAAAGDGGKTVMAWPAAVRPSDRGAAAGGTRTRSRALALARALGHVGAFAAAHPLDSLKVRAQLSPRSDWRSALFWPAPDGVQVLGW